MNLVVDYSRVLAYLLVIAAVIIPSLPVTTLAQQDNGTRLLHKFDLLLLSTPKKDDQTQSLLLVNTLKENRHDNVVLKLPSLNQTEDMYEHVTPDTESDTVYWTTSSGCIGYFGVGDTNRYGVVYNATEDHVITDLTYANNTLYWIEDAGDIKSLQLNQQNTSVRILVEAGELEKLQGLALDHKTGTLYYSKWPTFSRTNASIWSLETSSPTTPKLLASNLLLPTSLSISNPPHLNWISNPPGIYFHVERLNTNNVTDKKVIVKQAHQHGSSLAVSCNQVYWTDVGHKRLWQRDNNEKARKYNRIAGGKQVRVEVLGEEQRDWAFNEVVAVPHDCEQHHLRIETTTESSSSSSSESVEVKRTEHVKPDIRLCSREEFATTCTPNTGVICVFIEETRSPLCLSQQQQQPKNLRPTTVHPTSLPEPDPEQESNSTAETLKSPPPSSQSPSSWPPEVIILISVLSTLATVMSVISLYMTIRVRNLSRKPIIRRRVVVSTRTSESGSSTPASVCEMIDIENCCNMNVCETPCYERTLLQPSNPNTSSTHTSTTTQNGTTHISVNSSNSTWGGCGSGKRDSTKEDKRCLLR